MRRNRNHQPVLISGSERQVASHSKCRGTTNIGACGMRRVGRSGPLTLRGVRRGMLMVRVTGIMRMRAMQACSASI
jgi:hypothetical protein